MRDGIWDVTYRIWDMRHEIWDMRVGIGGTVLGVRYVCDMRYGKGNM